MSTIIKNNKKNNIAIFCKTAQYILSNSENINLLFKHNCKHILKTKIITFKDGEFEVQLEQFNPIKNNLYSIKPTTFAHAFFNAVSPYNTIMALSTSLFLITPPATFLAIYNPNASIAKSVAADDANNDTKSACATDFITITDSKNLKSIYTAYTAYFTSSIASINTVNFASRSIFFAPAVDSTISTSTATDSTISTAADSTISTSTATDSNIISTLATNIKNSPLNYNDLNLIINNDAKILINQTFSSNINTEVMEVFFLLDMIIKFLQKYNKKNKITLNLFYTPYARQNKEKDIFCSTAARTFFKMISIFSSYLEKIQTLDDHSCQNNEMYNENSSHNVNLNNNNVNLNNNNLFIKNFYNLNHNYNINDHHNLNINNIAPIYLIRYIKKNFSFNNTCIILPDDGAYNRFYHLLPSNFPIIILHKKRNSDNSIVESKIKNIIKILDINFKLSRNNIKILKKIENINLDQKCIISKYENLLILDDMIASGGTCAKIIDTLIAEYSLNINKNKFFILCSHLLNYCVEYKNLLNLYQIITTNSINDDLYFDSFAKNKNFVKKINILKYFL